MFLFYGFLASFHEEMDNNARVNQIVSQEGENSMKKRLRMLIVKFALYNNQINGSVCQ